MTSPATTLPPMPSSTGPGPRRHFRFPPHLDQALRERAAADGVTVTDVVMHAVAAHLGLPVTLEQQDPPPPVLTPSERTIARDASLGYSNATIAAGMGISVKMVEKSLTSAYRKLGCQRAGLADALDKET